jgi:hypothetical protein
VRWVRLGGVRGVHGAVAVDGGEAMLFAAGAEEWVGACTQAGAEPTSALLMLRSLLEVRPPPPAHTCPHYLLNYN